MRDTSAGNGVTPPAESSPLREALLNAIVLADSKGDAEQAAKILRGSLRRVDPADPARAEAMDFVELNERLAGAPQS